MASRRRNPRWDSEWIEARKSEARRSLTSLADQGDMVSPAVIKNLIKETKINDPIIYNFLIDTIIDPDKEIRSLVKKIILEIACKEINDLLVLKSQELNENEVKQDIKDVLRQLQDGV